MLSVELHKLVTGEKENFGPRISFRLAQNVLQSGNDIVAVYSAGLWRTQTNSFLVFTITAGVNLTYSNGKAKSLSHGPFDKLFVLDGTIHAGERDGIILARFDEQTGNWLCVTDRTRWQNIDFANASS